jgi:hypothetical protein
MMTIGLRFKNYCDSLTNNDIKNIIINNINSNQYNIIFKNIRQNYGDFIININQIKIPCIKSLLNQVPYFNMLFTDVDIENEMTLNVDLKSCQMILDLIHFQTIKLTKYNLFGCLELMDVWLMDFSYFQLYKIFIWKNIDKIVKMMWQPKYHKGVIYLMNHLHFFDNNTKDVIFNSLPHDYYIFNFIHWNKFNKQVQLNAMNHFKQYKLLKESGLSPRTILNLLATHFSNDILDYITMIINQKNVKYIYKNKSYIRQGHNSFINLIIHDYYPHFKCTILTKTPFRYSKSGLIVHKNQDIFYTTNKLVKLKLNATVVIMNQYHTTYQQRLYKIEKFKCINQNEYIIEYDKEMIHYGYVWKMTNYDTHIY